MNDPDFWKFNNADGRMDERMRGQENVPDERLYDVPDSEGEDEGDFDPCTFCSSTAHDSSDCEQADESVDEHLQED